MNKYEEEIRRAESEKTEAEYDNLISIVCDKAQKYDDMMTELNEMAEFYWHCKNSLIKTQISENKIKPSQFETVSEETLREALQKECYGIWNRLTLIMDGKKGIPIDSAGNRITDFYFKNPLFKDKH